MFNDLILGYLVGMNMTKHQGKYPSAFFEVGF
jgi:hypothetical protein